MITLPFPVNGVDPAELGNRLGFDLQFQSDKVCYFKNDKMRGKSYMIMSVLCKQLFLDLDSTIGDVYADIIDSQLEIMQQIVDQIVSSENLLKEALEICSELDW